MFQFKDASNIVEAKVARIIQLCKAIGYSEPGVMTCENLTGEYISTVYVNCGADGGMEALQINGNVVCARANNIDRSISNLGVLLLEKMSEGQSFTKARKQVQC